MKRIERPWDKSIIINRNGKNNTNCKKTSIVSISTSVTSAISIRHNDTNTNTNANRSTAHDNNVHDNGDNDDNDNDDGTSTSINIPFVEIDGIHYYCDRFYLNNLDDSINDTTSTDINDNEEPVDTNTNTNTNSTNYNCYCGANDTPPTIDISRLIATIDIQAIIFSTYTLDIQYLYTSFPTLFSTTTNTTTTPIPVLVQHGMKGYTPSSSNNTNNNTKQQQQQQSTENKNTKYMTKHNEQEQALQQQHQQQQNDIDDEPNSEPSDQYLLLTPPGNNDDSKHHVVFQQSTLLSSSSSSSHLLLSPTTNGSISINHDDDDDDDGQESLLTQEPTTPIRIIKSHNTSNDSNRKNKLNNHDENNDRVLMNTTTTNTTTPMLLSCNFVHYIEIKPLWVRQSTNSNNVTNNKAKDISCKLGVHHPKYIIIFEKCGSIIIIITTANLTNRTSTDATWIQRFYPKTTTETTTTATTTTTTTNTNATCCTTTPIVHNNKTYTSSHTTTKKRKNDSKTTVSTGSTTGSKDQSLIENDFGTVLADFLYCETLASASASPSEVPVVDTTGSTNQDVSSTSNNKNNITTTKSSTQPMTVLRFVQVYLQWKSLSEIKTRYDFSTSCVYLIPVVPGTYENYYCSTPVQQQQQQQQQRISVTTVAPKINTKQKIATPPLRQSSFNKKESVSPLSDSVVQKSRMPKYGRQRVAAIISKLCSEQQMPKELFSYNDRLIIQPTSFGAEWNKRTLTQVITSYLTDNSHTDNDRSDYCNKPSTNPFTTSSTTANENLLERLDIVWPTESYIENAVATRKQHSQWQKRTNSTVSAMTNSTTGRSNSSPTTVHEFSNFNNNNNNNKGTGDSSDMNERKKSQVPLGKSGEGYLFLSSDAFNSIDLACLSQMVMYETSYPPQQRLQNTNSTIRTATSTVPHIKSICRLFNGNDYRLRQLFQIPSYNKAEEYFSWFLLTSACLSRGAQGEDTIGQLPNTTAVKYSNFELGILFCSQIQKQQQQQQQLKSNKTPKVNKNNTKNYYQQYNRLYCWKPTVCTCRQNVGTSLSSSSSSSLANGRLVHLPIPYRLRATRYQQHDDEVEFCDTPYLHQILPGTGCVGNMLLTPLGSAIANEYKKAGL